MNEGDKIVLLKLSRKTIETYLREHRKIKGTKEEYPQREFWEERGTFVTLTENGALRGCIGTIYPVRPLVLDVIENSINAAFRDPRFYPVEESELPYINIEISILSVPEKIYFKDTEELFEKVIPFKHGVIIKKGFYQATFLPQVWEELSKPEDFFTHLCLKAGLNGDCFKEKNLEVEVYTVEAFSEKELGLS
uniref:AmmeMemoRadiSam system protein A n=1 Tax=Caldisericum exile TaxID=693075 RepID=A0A7C4U2J1_9BACT